MRFGSFARGGVPKKPDAEDEERNSTLLSPSSAPPSGPTYHFGITAPQGAKPKKLKAKVDFRFPSSRGKGVAGR